MTTIRISVKGRGSWLSTNSARATDVGVDEIGRPVIALRLRCPVRARKGPRTATSGHRCRWQPDRGR